MLCNATKLEDVTVHNNSNMHEFTFYPLIIAAELKGTAQNVYDL